MTDEVDLPPVRVAADNALMWAAVKDAVISQGEKWREQAASEMRGAHSERQRVLSAEGEDLGTVSLGEGRWDVEVADEAALNRWVADEHPTELWTPPVQIRPSYRGLLVEQARGGAEVPGLRRVWREGGLTVRANAKAKEQAAGFLGRVVAAAAGIDGAPERESLPSAD